MLTGPLRMDGHTNGTDTTGISCMGVGWVLTVRFDTQASTKIKYKFTIDIAQYPLSINH